MNNGKLDGNMVQGAKERLRLFNYALTCIISHLHIEAKSSMFIRSHLDEDQIIMRDHSIQLKEHSFIQIH